MQQHQQQVNKYRQIRYWCSDETRIGLMTIMRRKLTAKGVKPLGLQQWKFLYRWLYGAIEPLTGESFFLEFGHLDSICFEKFLELFATAFPHDLHIIQVDNGPLHQAIDLSIPDNVILLFQPPYTPEVNPIERLWAVLKSELKWENFQTVNQLQQAITKIVNRLSQEVVASVTGWKFIIDALCVANI